MSALSVASPALPGEQPLCLEEKIEKAPWQKTDSEGRFIDDTWLNGDPVWVLYELPIEKGELLKNWKREWIVTDKPQSIYHYALESKIAVAGEEPHLYGYRFVDRDCIFTSREKAEAECECRNQK